MTPTRLLSLVALGLVTCAPSPLLRRDDPVFARGNDNLRADASRISHVEFSSEQSLYLQAQAFDRYRFDLSRPRGVLSYLVQIAAAATDFAPLQVLAGSQGIFELRLRAYDGAAQLYEAQLARFPDGSLAPAALYRLGWVYRSTTTEGFPRGPTEAWDELTRRFPSSPEASLAHLGAQAPWKSQDAATLWSILPGAGQIYVGETLNGIVRLVVAAAFTALAILPIATLIQDRRLEWVPVVLSTAGLIGLQVCYTTAYQDAQRATLEFNEREEQRFEAAHPR